MGIETITVDGRYRPELWLDGASYQCVAYRECGRGRQRKVERVVHGIYGRGELVPKRFTTEVLARQRCDKLNGPR